MFGMTSSALRCVCVESSRHNQIATLRVLRRKPLVCEHGVGNDLDIHRKLCGPAIQPEPLETDMILDGRSPALRQAQFRVGPLQRVIVDCVIIKTVAAETQNRGIGSASEWCPKLREMTYKWTNLGITMVPSYGVSSKWPIALFSSSSEMPSVPRLVLYMSNKQLVTSQSYGNG
jgi:hypothetical protein